MSVIITLFSPFFFDSLESREKRFANFQQNLGEERTGERERKRTRGKKTEIENGKRDR